MFETGSMRFKEPADSLFFLAVDFKWLVGIKTTEANKSLDMFTLYEHTGHDVDDFITRRVLSEVMSLY